MTCAVTGLETRPTGKPLILTACATWLPAVSMMLVTTLSYIDRNTLALLAPSILHDTHLSNEQYGFIISGFSIAYMLCNPLWGRIVDRVGVRLSMGAAVSLWTLASISHAFAGGVRGFLAARTLLGIGEGGGYPGAVRTVAQTLPPAKRMRGIAIAYSGGSLGALLTPILITPIAAAWGWRGAFWFTGAVGALWLALWGAISRRRELDRPQAVAVESSDAPRWNDYRTWAFMSAFALGGAPIAVVLYQSSIYLSTVFHKSQIEIGYVLWIPPLGWEIGLYFWGWVTDRFASAGASPRALRWQLRIATLLSLPLAAVPWVRSYSATLAILFLAMFVVSAFNIGALAYATRQYSMKHSGLIAGLGSGSWSAAVALEMPVVGRLFDVHQYGAAFGFATLFPVAGYVIWRVFDRASTPQSVI
jgi:ACS family hexuronate transporter-like MFS transporter